MKFSYNKLEKFLNDNGFIIEKNYTIEDMCIYIEIIDIKSSECFILYIQSKYEIMVDNSTLNIYKLKNIIIPEDSNVSTYYINNIQNINSYEEIDVENEPENKMEEYLEKFYNYPINLKYVKEDQIQEVKSVLRQLKRLRLCVKYVNYKLCILMGNYICSIHKSSRIDAYYIKNSVKNKNYKLCVSLDLEILYENGNNIILDIKKVKEEVFNVLTKNQVKHSKLLDEMLVKKTLYRNPLNSIFYKKEKLSDYMSKMEKLLESLNSSERSKIEKINDLENEYSRPDLKGFHNDIEKTHKMSKIENELFEINSVKKDLFYNIKKVRNNYETLVLKIDNLCFDNIVMLDSINKNLETLISLC